MTHGSRPRVTAGRLESAGMGGVAEPARGKYRRLRSEERSDDGSRPWRDIHRVRGMTASHQLLQVD